VLGPPDGAGIPLSREARLHVPNYSTGLRQITAVDVVTIELVETDEHPTVVIIRWPDKPSVIHPRRFPDVAATMARLAADAHTALAAIKAGRRL
jgi:hypothetical protein